MKAPYLSLHDVGVRFKLSGRAKQVSHFEPLRGVSLDVRPGETLGVLGMNGAGKSTLLKIMSGALKPDNGRVVNHGASVALLSLQAGFDRNLTGRDNAIFGGMLLGCSKRHILTRLDEIQDYSELGNYFNEPVRTYSSGMAARLGFAISITVSPDVLLVDEVLSVGDAHFKHKAERTMMEKIVSGQTVVLVSHSRAQVENLCDRCVLLHNGGIIDGASVSDVLTRYDELIKQR